MLSPVSLREVLPDAEFVGCGDLRVSSCTRDSRQITPGQLFIAVRDRDVDGRESAAKAVARGASAVVLEERRDDAGSSQVIVADTRSAHARVVHAIAGSPSGKLPVFGVTGTRGKTLAVRFLRSILEAHGRRAGSIASNGWTDGRRAYPASAEVPDAAALATMLSSMVEGGCEDGLVSLSAESLSARHADGIAFCGAIVTGVRRDDVADLDARRSMARLVRSVVPGGLLAISADDPDAMILAAANPSARVVSFGIDASADVRAEVLDRDLDGTRFRLHGLGNEATTVIRPMGDEALTAALGAAAMALIMGIEPDSILAGLSSVAPLSGRLEPIARGEGRAVVISDARDEARLRRALRTVRERCDGQVVCVLSGNPGPSQAAGLARAAEQEADRVVLTTSSVHDGSVTAESWLSAFDRPGRVRVILDRPKSIQAALDLTRPGDALVLTGSTPGPGFKDRETVASWLRRQTMHATRRTA